MKIKNAQTHVRDGKMRTHLFVSGKHVGCHLRYNSRRGHPLEQAEVDRHLGLLAQADDAIAGFRSLQGTGAAVCHTEVTLLDFTLRVWHPEKIEVYARWQEVSHGDTRIRSKSLHVPADQLPTAESFKAAVLEEARQRCQALDASAAVLRTLTDEHGFSTAARSALGADVQR